MRRLLSIHGFQTTVDIEPDLLIVITRRQPGSTTLTE
jgi:hypothetical protein